MHQPPISPQASIARAAHVANAIDVLCNYIAETVSARVGRADTTPVPTSPYMSVAEAAEYARCSPQRVYDLRSDGTLGRHGDGRKALILRSELDAYIRSGPSPQ